MFVLVCYDVNTESKLGRRRLRRVAKLCESYGQRAQNSVFECTMDKALYLTFENKLINEIDDKEDNLRFYFVNETDKEKTKSFGINKIIDLEAPLII